MPGRRLLVSGMKQVVVILAMGSDPDAHHDDDLAQPEHAVSVHQAAEDVVTDRFSTRNTTKKAPLIDVQSLSAVGAGADAEEDLQGLFKVVVVGL
ncbi:MAG: hypothetical protein Q4D89_13715 [Arachnia propionica]|uniref:hypothetical protein n=1 Tax=Arachnia propionica TaxID=1750 RepID=UPI0026F69598|nr:hypothetical protein [Arachnia propionica]